jgi:hypothetical protein
MYFYISDSNSITTLALRISEINYDLLNNAVIHKCVLVHEWIAGHWQTLSHSVVSSTPPWTGFELTTLVLIGTDCIGSYKSNYHTITAKTALLIILKSVSMTVWYESLYTYWENFYYVILCPTYPTIPQRWTSTWIPNFVVHFCV